MFEVGRLVARIALEGAQTFTRDLRAVGSEFRGLSERGAAASRDVGVGLLAVGASITALAGLAIAKFASFDKAMSQVVAVTGAAADEQDRLRQAALAAGAVTVYTAEEAARAEAELGKAGVSTANILGGGLTGSLALAAAGQIEVADAAAIAATAMTQFRLSGDKIPHLADLLAAGANKAQGGVSDLGLALKQSGLVAAQMGLSVEETIGTLTAFASAGLLSSDAGTSFRTMLLSLATPSKQQAALLKEYNIQAYDAQGNFVGITKLAGSLQQAFKGATQAERDYALGVIFGSDAIRAANVLYNQGEAGIRKWTRAVDDSGYASKVAAELQNNLAGDVEKLGGAFDTALIKTGSGANGVLRDMTRVLTSLVDGYAQLPDFVQQGTLGVGLFAGGVALMAGAVLVGISQLANLRMNLRVLAVEMPVATARTKSFLGALGGPWGVAITAAIAILGAFAAKQAETAARAEELTSTLDTQTGAVTDNTRANVAARLAKDGVYEAAKRAGISEDELTDAILGQGKAMDSVQSKLLAYNMAHGTTDRVLHPLATDTLSVLAGAIDRERGALDQAGKSWESQQAAMKDSTSIADNAAPTYDTLADAVDGVVTSVSDLAAELDALNGRSLDARAAARELQSAYDDFDETLQRNGITLDTNTAAGRENEAALDGIARAAMANAQAILDAGGSASDYSAALAASRAEILNRIADLGITGQAAEDLADKMLKIPTVIETAAAFNTAAATASIDGWITAMSGRRIQIGVDVYGGSTVRFDPTRGGMVARANGGIDFYAGGGVRESHVAQIQRAGTTRVWAEPETGGESYIPLGASKRSQAEPVLRETARLMGFDLVPAGSGSSSAPKSSTSGAAPVAHVTRVYIGDRELRQIAREEIDDATTELAVAYEGGSAT